MSQADRFIAELTHEGATTRRVLERIPDEHLGWRPHAKSMTLGALAYHIAILPRAIADLLKELDSEPPNVKLPEGVAVAEIVATLDASLPYAKERIASWGDEGLSQKWRMRRGEQVLLELPRVAMVRSVMLNHWYHHRGQLTVYLRMHDVALPSVYGPSADESPFG